MNNIIGMFKRFLKNKNIVTIVGVVIILVLLYFGYSTQINSAVKPIKVVVAAETIQPRTLITEDMVTTIEMPSVSVTSDVIKNKYEVIDKYSNVNTMIPKGSMFFKQSVISEQVLPTVKPKNGEVLYSFPVDVKSTYGNSIFPGDKINIYMKTGTGRDNDPVMVGKLLENIEVLSVKDSSGRPVFENTSENRTPSMMLFGLKEKYNMLLKKASYIADLYVVPNYVSTVADKAEVSTQQLVDYINAHSVDLPIEDEEYVDDLLPTVTVKTVNKKYNVTIVYPEGCGDKYTCTYTMNKNKAQTVSKKTSVTISYNAAGTLNATVTEKDGTIHKLDTSIPLSNESNSSGTTNGTSNSSVNGQ